MPLDNLDLITVTGTWVTLAGDPASGRVVFTPSTTIIDPVTNEIILPQSFSVTLDANGQISTSLPATDDPDLSPTDWTYRVEEKIVGFNERIYNLALAYDGGDVDLSGVPVDVRPSTGTIVTTGSVGPAGPAGPQGPAGSSGASTADAVSITDAGGYYTGTDVEAALQEIGAGGIGGGTDDQTAAEVPFTPGTGQSVNTVQDALGVFVTESDPAATRPDVPDGVPVVWLTATEPTNWIDGDVWINDDVVSGGGGGGATNLAWSAATSTVTSDTGTDATLTAVDGSNPGLMSVADKSKLDGIETGATADQTGAEIKTAYEAEADTNAFTDAEKSKLAGVESGATADQTGAEIKTLYSAEANAYTDAKDTKLAGIEALADVTDEANVTDALDGATLTDVGTPASGDRVLLQDASDSNILKYAQFSTFGGGGGGAAVSYGLQIPSSRYSNGLPTGYNAVESAAHIANRVLAHGFFLPRDRTIDRMAVHITTAVASATLRLALYEGDDTDGYPGTLVLAATGTIDASTTGHKEITVSQAVPAGMYWAVVQTGSTGGAKSRTTALDLHFDFGRASGDVNPAISLSASRSDAALPADLSGTSWTISNNLPHGLLVRTT